jgi:hypothetical protein
MIINPKLVSFLANEEKVGLYRIISFWPNRSDLLETINRNNQSLTVFTNNVIDKARQHALTFGETGYYILKSERSIPIVNSRDVNERGALSSIFMFKATRSDVEEIGP